MALIEAHAKFDTETGQISWFDNKSNQLVVKAKKSSKKVVKLPKTDIFGGYDIIIGEVNYQLSPRAVEILGVKPGDRLKWGYKWINGSLIPIIATSETWDVKTGANLISKTFTVQCKGDNRKDLLKLGEKLKITPTSEKGYFQLVGDIEQPVPKADPGIEIAQDDDAIINDLNKLGDEPAQEEIKELTTDELLALLNN